MEGSESALDVALLLPLMLTGLIDAVSFMIVSPSIVFYVTQLGGTKEDYGAILSIFSLASFLSKPVLGYWCDRGGYKFRAPYLVSILIAALGGFIYFIASAFSGPMALYLLTIGRFLGGVGAANATLGFTYVAQVIPHEHMTKASSLLSMVRVLGMAAAPGLNVFVAKVDGRLFSLEIDPLNCIGLLVFALNALSFVVMYILLIEPPDSTKPESSSVDNVDEKSWVFWKNVLSLDIVVPLSCILSLNACFQLLETGLAPATSDALDWAPVQVSAVFGLNALFIFAAIVLTFQLSAWGVTDTALMMFGLVLSTLGYYLMYLWWSLDSGVIMFVIPVLLSTMAYPFLGAPTRSIFTKTVASKDHLRNHQGTMQAIMSMTASVVGFSAPGLIATFVLRTPNDVRASSDQREFTPYALFAPLSSVMVLIGMVYLKLNPPTKLDESLQGETSPLLSPEKVVVPVRFHPFTEAHRRHSTSLMGIPAITFDAEEQEERVFRNSFAL